MKIHEAGTRVLYHTYPKKKKKERAPYIYTYTLKNITYRACWLVERNWTGFSGREFLSQNLNSPTDGMDACMCFYPVSDFMRNFFYQNKQKLNPRKTKPY